MHTSAHPPLVVLDAMRLASIRAQLNGIGKAPHPALLHLVRQADEWLKHGPWSVTSKEAAGPSGDLHDYVSQAPYWWPSEIDRKLYVRRDGERNPEVFRFSDRWGAEDMMRATPILALAWYYTRRQDYAQHAARILSMWFLDPDTRMNPHLKHAQFIPGVNTGRSIGIIDFAQGYTEVLDAVAILALSSAPGWSEQKTADFMAWNVAFLDWLLHSEFGKMESAELNNHGDFAGLLKAGIAMFVGQHEIARQEVEIEWARILRGIDADGTQPRELARTRSWHYSCFRLVAVTRMAAIAGKLQRDLWTVGNCLVHRAVEFLIPFAVGDQPWPYEELDFKAWAASDLIHAAAEAGSVKAQKMTKKLSSCAEGDLWWIRPAPQQLDGPATNQRHAESNLS